MADLDKTNDRPLDDAELHLGPEYAVAERDVSEVVRGEIVAGSSLWRDAWRRLLRNKVAVFGMIVVFAHGFIGDWAGDYQARHRKYLRLDSQRRRALEIVRTFSRSRWQILLGASDGD